ncbi:hypothetical protein OJF2_46950 [Aquisphaera giovannonii]|uniref:Effector-associated domain-containing protein n=1 Tax=Aquisphaera giovannonii TaxID=406548 RepID=A0A5B9W7S0_9BACT|nr:effector-associated domain EAD1-containing protein [Aquisphaera giovannonii]QEH36135.1 hypothetical protein OJF2_46950 [Aquisphaera giovannonii]
MGFIRRRFTKEQRQRLRGIIADAFTRADLNQLVEDAFDEKLENIASPGNMLEVVRELILWSSKRGRENELLCALRAARPSRADVQAIAGELLPEDYDCLKSRDSSDQAITELPLGVLAHYKPWTGMSGIESATWLVLVLSLFALGLASRSEILRQQNKEPEKSLSEIDRVRGRLEVRLDARERPLFKFHGGGLPVADGRPGMVAHDPEIERLSKDLSTLLDIFDRAIGSAGLSERDQLRLDLAETALNWKNRAGTALSWGNQYSISDLLKDRCLMPAARDIDPGISLSSLLAPGNDCGRFDPLRAASIEGYVVAVRDGDLVGLVRHFHHPRPLPVETIIEISLTKNAQPNKRVRAILTPRSRALSSIRGDVWESASLKKSLVGHRVRLVGWVVFDPVASSESENTNPGNTQNSAATAWRICPVSQIRIGP